MRIAALLAAMLLAACASPTAAPPAQPTQTPPQPTQPLAQPPAQNTEPPTEAPLTNDFEPPSGLAAEAPPESPGEFRLAVATSSDGKVFTPTGQVIMDQANVPDMVMDSSGKIYLYFTGWNLGQKQNTTAVAISNDNGQSWVFKHINIQGWRAPVADPDVLLLPDGTFRLIFTAGDKDGQIKIWVTEGSDGLNFGQAKLALELPNESILDSTTYQINGQWHLLVLDVTKPEQYHANSTDGATFTITGRPPIVANGAPYILANGYAIDGGYRMIGFSIPQGNFLSFVSSDGETWTAEPGVVMAHDRNSTVESNYIKDPAVLPLPDGTYLMVYVTKLAK